MAMSSAGYNERQSQAIVEEARRRLASQGGKASMLPQMIEKVTQEFRQQESLARSRDGGGQEMSGNIDSYIDKVLGMSGLIDGAQAGGGGANVPTPSPRPDSSGEYASTPESVPTPSDRPTDVAGDDSDLWKYAGDLAAVGGIGYMLYKLSQRNKGGKNPQPDPTLNQDAGPDDPTTAPKQARPTAADAVSDVGPVYSDERLAIGHGAPAALADQSAPRPTAVDEMIDAIEGPRTDAGANVPQQSSTLDASLEAAINARSPEEIIEYTRQAGIELTPEQEDAIRQNFPTLRDRAMKLREQMRGVVSGAARGAAR